MKKNKGPVVFKRRIDHHWQCSVRTAANKPFRIGTGCKDQGAATDFANLLQRDINRRAEKGDMMPPSRS